MSASEFSSGKPGSCPNCGAVATDEFCPSCGQKNVDLHISLKEFAADALGTVFSLDNRIARTVIPLLFRPGLVTKETWAGKRARYVPPLRLYLFVSFIFFLSLSLSGGVININNQNPGAAKRGGIINVSTTGGSSPGAVNPDDAGPPVEPVVEPTERADEPESANSTAESDPKRTSGNAVGSGGDLEVESPEAGSIFDRAFTAVVEDPDAAVDPLLQRMAWMVFFLVPLFALYLKLLFRKVEPYFVPHLVFSLNLHSAALLWLTLTSVTEFLPGPDILGSLIILWLPIYTFRALRRVYGVGWWATLWRFALMNFVHILVLSVGLLGSLVLAGLSMV